MLQRLRLHAAKHRRTATFPAITVGILAHDVFIAPLAVTQDAAEIALCTGGHKQRRFKTQHCRQLVLQGVNTGVAAKHIVAQRRRHHRLPHGGGGLGNRIATQVNYRGHFGLQPSRNMRN